MKGPQTPGRKANGAIPAGRPDGTTSDEAIERVGRESTRRAGPDGPDASEVGDTFKRQPDD